MVTWTRLACVLVIILMRWRCTDELYLAHVLSTKAHARLVNVDPSEALSMSGVIDFLCYKDIPAKNNYMLLYSLQHEDETVFATDTVSDGRTRTQELFHFYFVVWFQISAKLVY